MDKKSVFIVYDLESERPADLAFEAYATKDRARARCVELNFASGYVADGGVEFDEDGECGWAYKEVEVEQ